MCVPLADYWKRKPWLRSFPNELLPTWNNIYSLAEGSGYNGMEVPGTAGITVWWWRLIHNPSTGTVYRACTYDGDRKRQDDDGQHFLHALNEKCWRRILVSTTHRCICTAVKNKIGIYYYQRRNDLKDHVINPKLIYPQVNRREHLVPSTRYPIRYCFVCGS